MSLKTIADELRSKSKGTMSAVDIMDLARIADEIDIATKNWEEILRLARWINIDLTEQQ